MTSSRRFRVVAAVLALISMLFMQLAMAAYACPDKTMMRSMSTGTTSVQQAMPGCEEMDMAQPGLCHAHADTGTQSLDKPDLPQVQPFLAGGLSIIVLPIALFTPDSTIDSNGMLRARATAPPLAIRNCCFRI